MDAATTNPGPSDCRSIAVNHVFNIPELLEAVLQDVPFNTLLASQRVNKQWKAVICGSRRLQQKLFLTARRPRSALRPILHQGENHDGLSRRSNIQFDTVPADSIDGDNTVLRATLNPILTQHSGDNCHRSVQDRITEGEEVNIQDSIIVEHCENVKTWSTSVTHDSYMNMFVCQPPVKVVLVHYFDCDAVAQSNEGVKFGHIMECCNRIREGLEEDFVQQVSATYGYTNMVGYAMLEFPAKGTGLPGPRVLFEPIQDLESEREVLKGNEVVRPGCGEVS